MKDRRYGILFTLIMLVLLLPLVGQLTGIKVWKLDGFVSPLEPVKCNIKTLRNDQYQAYARQYVRENFGFRSIYVRTYNQLLYSFFGELSNHNLVRGKDGELYLKQYTDVYTGDDLIARGITVDSARCESRQNIAEVLRLIDSLKRYDTKLLFVLAPSKTSVYPEFLPDSIRSRRSAFSWSEEYASLFKQHGIPHIDFIQLFQSMKTTESYPLYTRHGTHWDAAILPFVCDTLLRQISEVGGFPMPRILYLDSNISTHYKVSSDRELESTSNLLFPMRRTRIPNPDFKLTDIPTGRKPRLLVIADSYFTQLEHTCFYDAFEQVDYWKYNEDAYSTDAKYSGKVAFIDRHEIITKADVIVIMFTTMFAPDAFFGFPKTAMQTLQEGADNDIEKQLQNIIIRIKLEPAWYEAVKKQAKEKGMSEEECLRLNAKYVYEQTMK